MAKEGAVATSELPLYEALQKALLRQAAGFRELRLAQKAVKDAQAAIVAAGQAGLPF